MSPFITLKKFEIRPSTIDHNFTGKRDIAIGFTTTLLTYE